MMNINTFVGRCKVSRAEQVGVTCTSKIVMMMMMMSITLVVEM